MDWERYSELTALADSGRAEEALGGLSELGRACTDPVEKTIALMATADCLVMLGRSEEARQPVREAYTVLGEDSEFYPRLAFKDASIDMALGNWKQALTKIDAILDKYSSVLGCCENGDLLDHLRRSRGILRGSDYCRWWN